jgi:hypothetical protein
MQFLKYSWRGREGKIFKFCFKYCYTQYSLIHILIHSIFTHSYSYTLNIHSFIFLTLNIHFSHSYSYTQYLYSNYSYDLVLIATIPEKDIATSLNVVLFKFLSVSKLCHRIQTIQKADFLVAMMLTCS